MAGAKFFNTIEDMSRNDFHKNIVRKIGSREDFSKLVTFGAEALSEDEKLNLRSAMANCGIPLETTDSDMMLTATAHAIAARAVQLR